MINVHWRRHLSHPEMWALIGAIFGGMVVVALLVSKFDIMLPSTTERISPLPSVASSISETGFQLPTLPAPVFSPTEKLHYKIIYKGITVGYADLEVKPSALVHGRPTLQYTSTARSTTFLDRIFKVRDHNSSTVDQQSLYSVAFHQNLQEGKYKAVRNYEFNYKLKKFHSRESTGDNTKEDSGSLAAPVYDVLSAFFYTRTLPLKPGQTTTLRVYRNGPVKEMDVHVSEELKTIKSALGKVECLEVEPKVQGDSIFRSEGGRLLIWMTNDERKIPVLLYASVRFGKVKILLTNMEK